MGVVKFVTLIRRGGVQIPLVTRCQRYLFLPLCCSWFINVGISSCKGSYKTITSWTVPCGRGAVIATYNSYSCC